MELFVLFGYLLTMHPLIKKKLSVFLCQSLQLQYSVINTYLIYTVLYWSYLPPIESTKSNNKLYNKK